MYDEVWNKGNLEVADEVFHPESWSPSAPTLPPGPAGVKLIAKIFRDAFPDYWIRIDNIVAEPDRVAAHFHEHLELFSLSNHLRAKRQAPSLGQILIVLNRWDATANDR